MEINLVSGILKRVYLVRLLHMSLKERVIN
jgi:hypothetical protein